MKSPVCTTIKKQLASFSIVGLMLTIAPLWLMLATATTSAYAQTTASPADWTQFLRDNMERWNPYETILNVNNVGGLGVKWAIESKSINSVFRSSPAVVNGMAYVGSVDHNVYALNASTGATLWSFQTGDIVQSSPAVVNGVVYIGSTDGNLYALNAGTGALLWSFDTGSASVGGIDSSPAVVNGVVYFGAEDTNVYALNASTGAKLWSYTTGGFLGLSTSPAVANGAVYIGAYSDNVYALNASTGAKLWSAAVAYALDSSAAVANGMVYINSGDGNAYALNASTGKTLWSYDVLGDGRSSPAVANGVVYLGAYYNVYALNAGTGALLWKYTTGGGVDSSPAVANGVVYVGSDDGNLYALNASTGGKLWSYPVGIDGPYGSVIPGPVVVDGMVYATVGEVSGNEFGNGYVYAFDLGVGADLFLRILPSTTTVHQGDLITYTFPVWNLGAANADQEVLNTQVPAGTTFDSISISGTPGLGTCTTPPFQGTGQIVCHENGSMAPNTTWTVQLTVKVTGPAGSVITENASTMSDTPDPNMANNTATVSLTVQGSADLFLRVTPSTTTVHQGDLITYAFPVWNLGSGYADLEVLTTQVPAGTTFDSIRISGTPGLGTCTTPPYQGTGQIVCHENAAMAPNTTWTVRLTVKVTAPSGTVITANAATMSDTPDPNLANNTATVSLKVQ